MCRYEEANESSNTFLCFPDLSLRWAHVSTLDLSRGGSYSDVKA